MLNPFPTEIIFKGKAHKIPPSVKKMKMGAAIETEMKAQEIIAALHEAQERPESFPKFDAVNAFCAALAYINVEHDEDEVLYAMSTEQSSEIIDFLYAFALSTLPPIEEDSIPDEPEPQAKGKAKKKQ